MPSGGSLVFSIPTSIKFDFESLEMGKDLIEELINTLPDFNILERKIDVEKFFFFFKKKEIQGKI